MLRCVLRCSPDQQNVTRSKGSLLHALFDDGSLICWISVAVEPKDIQRSILSAVQMKEEV